MRRRLWGIALFSALHFAIAMLIAILAFGLDLDQLRSRTAVSRAAANVHDILWWPHDTALRSLPNDWIAHNTYFIPIALVLNSLLWGAAIYIAAAVIFNLRLKRPPAIR